MSVINKMLKDLEQREQKQSADFASGSSSAVYQPKKSNNLTLILTLMFVVILALAGAVSWLLFNNKANTSIEPVAAVNSTESTAKQAQQVEPESTSVEVETIAVQVAKSATLEQSSETTNSQSEEPAKPEFRLTEEYIKTEREIAELDLDDTDDEEVESDESELEPVEQQVTKPEPVKFKIEKTPSHLTREQRLEKLMEKAQNSFDKGYITDAITQLEEVLNSADNHVEARNLLAVAWYGRGELQQAVSILNNGLNRYPNIEKWRLTAAKIFFKENELPGAFSYLEADLPAASVEYYTMKGTLARQLQRFDKAETAYASLTKLEPNKGSWWLGHAIALDSQNKSKEAVSSYKQAIAQAGISPTSLQFAQQRIKSLQE